MVGDTWDSKDDHKFILDIEGSRVDTQTPDVITSGGRGLWTTTTTHRELWCFYLCYVVRYVLRVPTLRFHELDQGQQCTLRLQLWSIPFPKPALPRRLRPKVSTILRTVRQRYRMRAALSRECSERRVVLLM